MRSKHMSTVTWSKGIISLLHYGFWFEILLGMKHPIIFKENERFTLYQEPYLTAIIVLNMVWNKLSFRREETVEENPFTYHTRNILYRLHRKPEIGAHRSDGAILTIKKKQGERERREAGMLGSSHATHISQSANRSAYACGIQGARHKPFHLFFFISGEASRIHSHPRLWTHFPPSWRGEYQRHIRS